MKKNLFYILLLFCLSSCHHKESVASFHYNDELIGIGLADNYQMSKLSKIDLSNLQVGSIAAYSDFFSDVKYIPLELTEMSMLGEIRNLQITNNGDFIVFDDSRKSILHFDKDGKFMNPVGNIGRAKGEYISPTCMAYDEYRNQVMVYDSGKCKLLCYSIDGKFMTEIETPPSSYEFEILDSNNLILYMNHQEDISCIDGLYNYVIINRKGEVVGCHAPYCDNWKNFTMSSNVFSRNNGHIFTHIPGTPLVNELVNDSLKTLYYVDFGKYSQPEEWFESYQSYQKNSYSAIPDNVARSVNFYQTEKFILMNFSWDSQALHLLIAKKDSVKNPRYARLMDNDIYGQVNAIEIKSVKGDKVYFVIDPNQFKYLANIPTNKNLVQEKIASCRNVLSQINKNNYSVRALYKNLEKLNTDRKIPLIVTPEEKLEMSKLSKNNNPIIQICTLK